MALKQCPECGHTVSTQAEACPGCGFPMRESPVLDYVQRRVHLGLYLSWLSLSTGALLFLIGLVIPSGPAERLLGVWVFMSVTGALGLAVNTVRQRHLDKSKRK